MKNHKHVVFSIFSHALEPHSIVEGLTKRQTSYTKQQLQNMSDHERNKLGLEKKIPFLLGPLEPLEENPLMIEN